MRSVVPHILSLITILISVFLISCGSPPDGPPVVPDDKVWVGSLQVSTHFDSSMVGPVAYGVILDGDSLFLSALDDIIHDVPEGQHSVRAFHRQSQDVVYRSVSKSVFVEHDKVTHVSLTLTRTGVISLTAFSELDIDSIVVKLDSDTLDLAAQPLLLEGVTQGVHKIVAFASNDSLDLEGWLSGIEVIAAETTEVSIELTAVAPDSGSHAPDIECVDLDGENWSLSDHWGKVVYLYFFEHT